MSPNLQTAIKKSGLTLAQISGMTVEEALKTPHLGKKLHAEARELWPYGRYTAMVKWVNTQIEIEDNESVKMALKNLKYKLDHIVI